MRAEELILCLFIILYLYIVGKHPTGKNGERREYAPKEFHFRFIVRTKKKKNNSQLQFPYGSQFNNDDTIYSVVYVGKDRIDRRSSVWLERQTFNLVVEGSIPSVGVRPLFSHA